jgi:hypothetical protein
LNKLSQTAISLTAQFIKIPAPNWSMLLKPLLIIELAALGMGTGFLAGLLGTGAAC